MGVVYRPPSRFAWAIAALSVATIGAATPSGAATSDAAYCAQLAALAMNYTGTSTAGAAMRPGPLEMWAVDHCKDRPAEAIPMLEKTLRDNRVPLPVR